jgi:hypothetical protein
MLKQFFIVLEKYKEVIMSEPYQIKKAIIDFYT